MLTHRNILSNAAQAAARIDFHSGDKVFNILPVFHSFGLTAGTILPLISGVPIYFYPSPLHYRDRAGADLCIECDDHLRHRHLPVGLCADGAPLRLPLDPLHLLAAPSR